MTSRTHYMRGMRAYSSFLLVLDERCASAPAQSTLPLQVRRKEIEDKMEYQFKQGMTAPDWEMDDYGW